MTTHRVVRSSTRTSRFSDAPIIRSMLAIGMIVAVGACGSSGGGDSPTAPAMPSTPGIPTAPAPDPTPTAIIAGSPTLQTGLTGALAWISPRFWVVNKNGNYLSNVTVSCTVSDGSVSPNAVTNASGMAFCTQWTLGANSGEDTLVVGVQGASPLIFVASARDAGEFEIYDLRLVAGMPVPYSYSSGVTIDSGQFLLSPDGTFFNSEMWSGSLFSSTGVATRSGETISFYLYGSGYKYAIGRIVGDSLKIEPQDLVDFDSEVYIKRK